ncbi:phosphatase PAP2 family protein [Bacillus marasmi]|uniref:phosphatase PAP2 family protein n=1 Tax=Bacillus marasmi TaxID=1926279 RepID=UPI0024831CD3|nr:phosphatase PAP2 family protein [Bacillus marasmi]
MIAFTLWLSSLRYKHLLVWLAFGIVFSRIWVGVHYPFDVAAGILNGLMVALFTHYILFKLKITEILIEKPIFQRKGQKEIVIND